MTVLVVAPAGEALKLGGLDRLELANLCADTIGEVADAAEDALDRVSSDAHLRPADGRQKVYLILNAEELREDAADRLLKTVEEPPPFVTFFSLHPNEVQSSPR